MCIKRSGLWEFVVLSVVLLLYGLFSPCFAEAFVGSRAAIRAVRRGTLSTTYRDMRIGGRLGGQLGWLRSGSDAHWVISMVSSFCYLSITTSSLMLLR